MQFKTFVDCIKEREEEYSDFNVFINNRPLTSIDICYMEKPLIERGDPKNIYITLFTNKTTENQEGYYTFIEKKE